MRNKEIMTKYLIVSDIHGSLPALEQTLAFYKNHQCGMLCLLGDILNYGPRNGIPEGLDPKGIAERLNAMADEIVAIRGNCDSEVDQMMLDFPILSDYFLLVDNGKRFFLTHGHLYNDSLLPKSKFDCFFYGHTHRWKLEPTDRGVICNTGSITFPKEGNAPTFAVYCNGTVSIHRLDGSKLKELSF